MEKAKTFFQKFKNYFILVGVICAGVIGGIISFIFTQRTSEQIVIDLRDAISTRKVKDGTQVLPIKKGLDKTLDEIEKDIIK